MPQMRIKLSPGDVLEIELLSKYVERRRTHPDETARQSYAEVYGTVVYEAPAFEPIGNLNDLLAYVGPRGECDSE